MKRPGPDQSNHRLIASHDKAHAAVRRLLSVALSSTGQSRRVADFLLAWWNPERYGGFDMTAAWCCDDAIVRDMVSTFALAVTARQYPDTLGYEKEFTAVVRQWRPELSK
jgi:hypothetical protein